MSDQLTVLGSKIGIDKDEYINITDSARFRSEQPNQVFKTGYVLFIPFVI